MVCAVYAQIEFIHFNVFSWTGDKFHIPTTHIQLNKILASYL